LGAIGKVAFPAIFGALKELDEKGRVAAAQALGFAKDPDPEAVKQLAGACLGEEQAEVRAAMIATLSTWRLEPGRFLEILVPSLKSENESLQQAAMNGLILLERPGATSVPALLPLLTGDDLAVAQRAARTLGHMGLEAGGAAAALERLAQDEALSEESRGVFEDVLKSVRR
jgi:HEAT repeat protein